MLTEYSRLISKRSTQAGVVPTIPTGTTLNDFTATDIFVGEIFINVVDDTVYTRTNNGILQINAGGSTGGDFLPLSGGTVTGDTIFTSGLTANTLNVGGIDFTSLSEKAIVVTGNTTAENDKVYHTVANATFTDPSTAVNGRGYMVYIMAGNATIGPTTYNTQGTLIFRRFSQGVWQTRWFLPSVTNANGGFAESTSNKTNDFNTNNTTNYPNSQALFNGLATKFNTTGGTINGGLTATTISATTYQNLPVITPTLNTVLTSGNTTGGQDIIVNDTDKISNTGGTAYMEIRSGSTIFFEMDDNSDKKTNMIFQPTVFTIGNQNVDDGWYGVFTYDDSNNTLINQCGYLADDTWGKVQISSTSILYEVKSDFNDNRVSVTQSPTSYTIDYITGSTNSSRIRLTDTGLEFKGDIINIDNLPASSSGLSAGDLFTQTATQLGGTGTTKVICIV
jgi:hypothetical protein